MNEIDYDVNSMYAEQVWKPATWPPSLYKLNDSFEHEGTTWYQLKVYEAQIAGWIENQDDELWWSNTPDWKDTGALLLYTVHEKLYSYICLKWT